MTYQEAINEKEQKTETTFFHEGVNYVWMVVPKNPRYLEEYAKDCLTTSETFFDETSKRYAKDNQFMTFAVRMLR